MERKIDTKEMLVSEWSGGTTTQIAIYPENSTYADRDFIFRISTASVNLDESDFTHLPDYNRLIASISGKMILSHDNGNSFTVEPFSNVYYFDGGIDTHCVGHAVDLNLMLRKNLAEGELRLLNIGEKTELNLGSNEIAVSYGTCSHDAVYMRNGMFSIMPTEPTALFIVTLL